MGKRWKKRQFEFESTSLSATHNIHLVNTSQRSPDSTVIQLSLGFTLSVPISYHLLSHKMDRNTSDNIRPSFGIQAATFRPSYQSPSIIPFKLDEGYSEDTRSQTENEAAQMTEALLAVPEQIMALSEEDRAGSAQPFRATRFND